MTRRPRRFHISYMTLCTCLALYMLPEQRLHAETNQQPSQTRRPNILYIMTDQQSAGAMSCAGNKDLKTPAMDSIARNGVLFAIAYCSQPLCVPSRTSMMTGKMPHETGVDINLQQHKIHAPMMGTIFSQAGYDCGYVGKWHLTIAPTEKKTHGFTTIEHARGNRLDMDVPASCVEFIRRERSGPFLLVASFVNPHDICEWARGDDLKNGSIPEPPPADQCPALPDNFEIPTGEPDMLRVMQTEFPLAYPTIQWPPDRWRQYRWAYYRLVEKVDGQIGIILDTLRQSGQEENTVIIFSSDHGDGMGAHNWNQKQVLYEEAIRVPFIVSHKGVTKAGHVDREHLVSSGLDLIPTICDYANISIPEGLRGLSVRKLAEGRQPKQWRDSLVSETVLYSPGISLRVTGRMLRTAQHKYIVYSKGNRREQLFDIQRDPGEMIDLADKPEYRTILRNHRKRLADWCKDTHDTFAVPANN